MKAQIKTVFLVLSGILLGLLLSFQFSAFADRNSPLPVDELKELSDVFAIVKSDYVEPVSDKQLLVSAISGMVSSLDPHSAYLDKKLMKELRESTQGRFVGLGIEIGMEEGLVKVISPIDGSPALRAGIRSLDLISRIDQTPVKGLTLDEAVKKMRGEPGSKVTLTILRKGETKPLILSVIREEIQVQSIKAKIVEPGFGWLRIAQFQEHTVDDMAKKLIDMYNQDPKIKGLVLDLRNDPGGLLQGAIGVTAAFVKPGEVVVSTNGQLSEQKSSYLARSDFYGSPSNPDPLQKLPSIYKNIPLVVLVNSGSASASEIVAGALQDYRRATIMGTPTFGKGSVQTIRLLSADTGLKLTTARYYTPKGRSIQAKGIVPDLLVNEREDGKGFDSLRIREADLQKHLSNTTDEAPESPANLDEDVAARLPEKDAKPLEYGSKEDFQLTQALNKLKGLPVIVAKK